MPAGTEYAGMADADLAARVGQADRHAFEALYRRHVGALFDFASRLLRDPDGGADVVQATFVKAWDALSAGRVPGHVRAWLFAVARNAAIDELRRRQRGGGDGAAVDLDSLAAPAGEPGQRLAEGELASLVWESAAALNPDDYALLDLHLRQGLSADDLAEALGLRKGAVYTRLSRLRDALAESVVALLLSRHGRKDCPALDGVLARLPDATPRRTRKAVRGHLRAGCQRCEDTRRRAVAPASLFSALVPVPLDDRLRNDLWRHVEAALDDPDREPEDGAGPSRRRGAKRGVVAAAVAAVVVVATAVVAVAGGGGRAAPRDPTGVRSTTHAVGRPTTADRVRMMWRPEPSAAGYSVRWSRDSPALPDTVADLPGSATATTSPRLRPGTWWFVLRTQGRSGGWTSTVTVGPLRIVAPAAAPPTAPTSIAAHSPPTDPASPQTDPTPTTPATTGRATTTTPPPGTAASSTSTTLAATTTTTTTPSTTTTEPAQTTTTTTTAEPTTTTTTEPTTTTTTTTRYQPPHP